MYAKNMQHFKIIKRIRPQMSSVDNLASKGRASVFYSFLQNIFEAFIKRIRTHIHGIKWLIGDAVSLQFKIYLFRQYGFHTLLSYKK